jgi:phosphatidylglycerol:prolipoprotein diacylglycerol transferase
MPFPDIDPVIFSIGPFALRWYALAYIAGLVLGWLHVRRIAAMPPTSVAKEKVDDFLVWATFGVIFGGRLGYVLFYKPGQYFANPGEILAVWQGGMSFHGGFLGVVVATILFCRRHSINIPAFGDTIACAAPIGLFFGRVANFINGELFGRVTDAPVGVIFPHGGPDPRHPSQLYEAVLEGLLLFLVMFALRRFTNIRQTPGALCGVFLLGYGLARFIVEFFREPDAHLGFLFAGATMGQLLSLPMVVIGIAVIFYARRAAR